MKTCLASVVAALLVFSGCSSSDGNEPQSTDAERDDASDEDSSGETDDAADAAEFPESDSNAEAASTNSEGGSESEDGPAGTGGDTSRPAPTVPDIFGALAGVYEADFSAATAIVCGSLLPVFDGEETVSGLDCGSAGVHRLEVTEGGSVRFLDTTEAVEFIWSSRSRELPPSETRLNGGVEYMDGEGVCCIERYIARNLTMMYPSADELTFNLLALKVSGNMMPDVGEATAPLTRIE